MIPRLTTRGRRRVRIDFVNHLLICRPSPAERLRQRRKARAASKRWNVTNAKSAANKTWKYEKYLCDNCDDEGCFVIWDSKGWRREPCQACSLPQSRGTTTAQLVAMHLEAESDNDR